MRTIVTYLSVQEGSEQIVDLIVLPGAYVIALFTVGTHRVGRHCRTSEPEALLLAYEQAKACEQDGLTVRKLA